MRFFCFPPWRMARRQAGPFRLRVIAHSDAPMDQAAKLRVRDAVYALAKPWPEPLAPVRRAVRALDPTARVRRGRFHFGGYTSPAIEIRLGQAAGHNWWGILFPAAEAPADEPVQFESWILTLLRKWGWIA